MKHSIFALICVLGCFSTSFAQSKKTVPMEVYVMKDSKWEESVILEKIKEANVIMNQCGIELKITGPFKWIEGVEEQGRVRLLSDIHPEFEVDEIDLHKKIDSKKGSKIVRALFVGAVPNLSNVFGVSRRTEHHEGEIYENSFYISNQLGISGAGQTVAHELGHVLLNEGHYHIDPSPNIMHYQLPLQNDEFNKSQCQKMRKSPLVRLVK